MQIPPDQEPPVQQQEGPPMVMVPMLDLPTPQHMSWEKVTRVDGTVVAKIWCMWSHVSTLIMLEEGDGLKLADGLREMFGGIQIVRALPESNGDGLPIGPFAP